MSKIALTIPELIAAKRDGRALSEEQIQHLIAAYTAGDVTDYQMAAFAMATFFKGMTPKETAALTLAMRDSGDVMDLSRVKGIKVDKHSTGGVGDKVSICLAPMVAACGVPVPMISGRGLGHTGGTVDKLEAIPGFQMGGSPEEFAQQLADVGCSLFKQTADLAPADRKFYALRDVTATVESIPLITGSILSKKLAEGIDALVLDVKVGKGAFMKTEDDARALARSIVRVGKVAGKKVSAILTRMDAPLGNTVGNAIETREALEVLHGKGPSDLIDCTMALAIEMLRLGGVARSDDQARKKLEGVIADGSAIRKMEEILKAQGADPKIAAEPDRLEIAKTKVRVTAPADGFVREINALEVGYSGVMLGAGRTRSDQEVDPAVGITITKKLGDEVKKGQTLATLHVHDRKAAKAAAARVKAAYTIGAKKPRIKPLIVDTIRR